MHPPSQSGDQDIQDAPLFLTLFPAHYGVQIAIVLACQERYGFFPTHLLLAPERYAACTQRVLFLPYPQEEVQQALSLYEHYASKEETGRATAPASVSLSSLPPLAGPPLQVLRVGICADPELTWYQVRCLASPNRTT